jgi:hypothetical protein
MDDFVLANLYESKNEWCGRLVTIFTPLINEGIKSIFNEAVKLCDENGEQDKYLMTFQNLLSRIPKWNTSIIEEEVRRIIERSGCNYLEDLITCVHIIQLKVLTCVRVGNKQKKIDISIPSLDNFIHKVYISSARKCYSNVYLFESRVSPLLKQKNNRELEQIIQECILTTIRESIPTEQIIRAYMDESVEQEEEVTVEEVTPQDLKPKEVEKDEKENINLDIKEEDYEEKPTVPAISNITEEPVVTKLTFNDYDSVQDNTGNVENIKAPKDIERLEEISNSRAIQRQLEEEDDDDFNEKIQIHTDNVDLGALDILDINKKDELLLDDIEVLE